MTAIGIDVGGTFAKGARLHDGAVAGEVVRRQMPAFDSLDGPVREIDPDKLMIVVREVLHEVSAACPVVDEIWITGQMASIAFTGSSGEAIAPIVSWQDLRSGSVDRTACALGEREVAKLGDGLRPELPLVRLSDLRPPPGAHVSSLLGFVASSLCILRPRLVHATDAAAWGLVDIGRMRWSQPALAHIGITTERLPEITSQLVPLGREVALGARVMVAVGDQQASLFGASIGIEPFIETVSVNLATGGQVSVVSRERASRCQTRPYFGGQWLHTVTHLPAGRLLTAAVISEFGGATPADWAVAVDARDPDGPVSAAMKTIAGAVHSAIQRLGAVDRPLRFSGGLVQKFRPLRRMIVEVVGAPSTTFGGEDAALAGLARLAHRNRLFGHN